MGCFNYQPNFIVFNIGFYASTQKELVKIIEGLDVSCSSAYVTFDGVIMSLKSRTDKDVVESHKKATLCAVDGMPIVWIAKQKGLKSCQRCSGPDIMSLILEEGIKKCRRHFFYGGTEETLKLLQINLEEQFPGIQIVGTYSPPFRQLTEEEDNVIVDMINASRPDYLWVGLGAPKQDIWMMEHKDRIYKCRMMGVGAAFNFFAGTLSRAPIWMRKSGLEWLYRLYQEPSRLWKRYLIGNTKFIWFYIVDSINGAKKIKKI